MPFFGYPFLIGVTPGSLSCLCAVSIAIKSTRLRYAVAPAINLFLTSDESIIMRFVRMVNVLVASFVFSNLSPSAMAETMYVSYASYTATVNPAKVGFDFVIPGFDKKHWDYDITSPHSLDPQTWTSSPASGPDGLSASATVTGTGTLTLNLGASFNGSLTSKYGEEYLSGSINIGPTATVSTTEQATLSANWGIFGFSHTFDLPGFSQTLAAPGLAATFPLPSIDIGPGTVNTPNTTIGFTLFLSESVTVTGSGGIRPVPEPSSLSLAGVAISLLCFGRWIRFIFSKFAKSVPRFYRLR